MPEGSTFRYQELPIERQEYTAAAKAIERLVKNGLITHRYHKNLHKQARPDAPNSSRRDFPATLVNLSNS